jgi:hypothetical protein
MKFSFVVAVTAGAFKVLSGIGVVQGHDDDLRFSGLAGVTLKGIEGGNYARRLMTPVDNCDQSMVLNSTCPSPPGGPPGFQVYFAKYDTDNGWESGPGSVSVIVIICS